MTSDGNDAEDLAAAAEHQRAELATTVEALAAKADVPARMRRDPKLAALLGGTVAGVLTVAVLRRIRRHRTSG